MKQVKKITRPDLPVVTAMNARDLNAVHFSDKRTVLTPELLEKMAKSPKN